MATVAMPEVLSNHKHRNALLSCPQAGSFCMAFTVAMPEGVAALPNPKRFAVRFIVTAFMTSGQCAASLNSSLDRGIAYGQ